MAPIDLTEAAGMTGQIKGARALDAFRGRKAVDRTALAGQLMRLGLLALDFDVVREIDINPVLALEQGCLAVDARIVLEQSR